MLNYMVIWWGAYGCPGCKPGTDRTDDYTVVDIWAFHRRVRMLTERGFAMEPRTGLLTKR